MNIRAKNILEIVRHHKKHCDGEKCNVTIYFLLEDFERHIGRKATSKEVKEFF